MGLPNNWQRVREWIDFKGPLKRFVQKNHESDLKLVNLEIPILSNYEKNPDNEFWSCFPKKELPISPESNIDAKNLDLELEGVKNKISTASFLRGKKAVHSIENGAPSY